MKLRLMSLALIMALLGAFVLAPMNASAQRAPAGSLDVTGTVTDLATGDLVGGFDGTISNLLFSGQGGVLNLSGVLNGTVTDAEDNVVQQITNQAFNVAVTPTVPGENGAEGCQILFLDLGPIFLDLLGLQVDLSRIVLDITAVPGPGNLLGNLLCAVAGLLDRGGPAQGLSGLLNNLLRNLLG